MFRKLGKDIIACVEIECNSFKKLKEMNVIIPEIHEKMWTEKLRWEGDGMVFAKVNYYKLIELLDKYDIYYILGHDEDNELDKLYKECMEEKINEYRVIEENNNK
jgi:hypothetical protein